jgi:hypothetical protein
MPNKIKPKRSYTANAVPTTSDLDTHELAINWADSKAFTKNAAGQIVSVTLGGGGGSGEDAALRALFVPPAPTGLAVTAGNAQASLSWTAPTGVIAQAPITDYREQFSSDNGATWTTFTAAASTATTATVTGLTNGTAYVFRVAAVNAVGVGAYTAASSAVTPTAGDPLFSNVQLLLRADSLADSSSYARTVTASGASISTATKKYGSGSFAISGSGQYIAVAGSSALNMSGDFCIEWWQNLASATAQGWLIGGNANSSGYFMLGVNLTGAGQLWIGEANVGWPVQFNGISLTSNQWQHIAISRTGSTNRLYIDGTRVGTVTDSNSWVVNPNSIWIGSQAAGTSINGFIDELRWTVGNNRSYTGDTLQVPAAAFPDGAMSAPTSLAATAGNAQVSLTWTAPSYNGGSAITDYSVQVSADSGSNWTTFSRTASTTASQVVTGLTNGTSYVFRVAGVNANGTGTYTAASSSVTPFAPTSIAGLQLWLDASDAGSLFDATSGGSLVAADGGVARWEDKSGNGRHATQSTSGSRPLRKTGIKNGLPVLRFDGSNDLMSIPSSAATFKFLHGGSTGYSIFAVVGVRALNTRERILETGRWGSPEGDGGGIGCSWSIDASGGFRYDAAAGGTTVIANSSASGLLSTPNFYALSNVGNVSSGTASVRSSMRVNGGAAITNNSQTGTPSTANSRLNLTFGFGVGHNGDGTIEYEQYADLDFCEIIIYNSALSDAERAAVEQYLISKWSIT